ncbi:hypothetical protein L195_g044711 [Trifolium pratense]|uniref:Uncharacterized protein n=1 Tax=Trifolium pratense TaxID=57577 RepID=A0A2K3MCU7_TRIPR|nr:hypothetical protein L195_g044711 [Trifolium pratense]
MVDMSLSKCLFNGILVEHDGYVFNRAVIGHHITACKWLHSPRSDNKEAKEKKLQPEVVHKIIKEEYVAKIAQKSQQQTPISTPEGDKKPQVETAHDNAQQVHLMVQEVKQLHD